MRIEDFLAKVIVVLLHGFSFNFHRCKIFRRSDYLEFSLLLFTPQTSIAMKKGRVTLVFKKIEMKGCKVHYN